jgi:hypothetical protein
MQALLIRTGTVHIHTLQRISALIEPHIREKRPGSMMRSGFITPTVPLIPAKKVKSYPFPVRMALETRD